MSLWSVRSCYLGSIAATLGLLHTPCLALASRWLPGWFSPHSIQTWGSELGAIDDDADGSDAAVERKEVETVEEGQEGGEDQSGGRPLRMLWWRQRPK